MKVRTKLRATNPHLLEAYVILFKEYKTAKDEPMATKMLVKIQSCFIDDGWKLKDAMRFYRANLKGYIKFKKEKI